MVYYHFDNYICKKQRIDQLKIFKIMSTPKPKLHQILSMPIGMILLALAIIINRFLPESSIFDFISGLFFGLSIVLNVYYIFVTVKKDK
jgi:hypothetical protein